MKTELERFNESKLYKGAVIVDFEIPMFKHTMARCLCYVLFLALSLSVTHSSYAFEINSPITQPIHENITKDALFFLREGIYNTIVEANRRVDLDSLTGDSLAWEHFDNCQFSESVNHINDLYLDALSGDTLDLTTVATNFGTLLHTAQDFYAHSNWIELGKTYLFDNNLDLWNSIAPFMTIDNVMIIEGETESFPPLLSFSVRREGKRVIVTTSDGELLGLISGVAYTSEGCPNNIEIGHWDGGDGTSLGSEGLNKDNPGRDGFEAARRLAVAQTTHEWCRLVNLVSQRGGDAAVVNLFNAWVEPTKRDDAIAACPDLNLDVLSKLPASIEEEIVLATAVPGSNLLDLIFVIDTTGSMQDDINEVQRRALEIINQVAASGSDWRIGIVTFRDHPQAPYGDPGDYVAQLDLPFSSDQNQIVAGINRIVVGGGGDGPEAVFAGVLEAIGQPWRNGARKVVILMGDAPPHDPDPVLGYTMETVLQAAYDVDPASIFPILIESANAVRFPFQALADGSSGRLFYASNAEEVVPTLLNTIALATGVQLSLGLEVQIASLEPDFPLQTAPSMRASTISRVPRSEQATIIEGPEVVFEMSADNVPQNFIWWKIRTASGSEGWIQETYYGEPILVPFVADNPVVPASCILTTRGDVNIRSGPGLNYQQIASRAGEGNLLAANGQFGNIAVVQEHWWQLIDGFWIRNDQVRESEGCPSLPVVAVT